jgi:hypothetical protein
MHANTADSSLVWSENANDIYFSSGNIGLGTNNPGILNYSHPVKVFTLQDLTGATSIEMSGNRISDGESIGWITYLHDSNRILDMVVTRENSGSSGSLHVRTNNGDGGTNPSNMTTQFTITESGDVFLNHSSNGVIMKSPDGQCWKFTVGNTGDFVGTSTTCPN